VGATGDDGPSPAGSSYFAALAPRPSDETSITYVRSVRSPGLFSRLEPNAIHLPSGENEGKPSKPSQRVSWRSSPVSRLRT